MQITSDALFFFHMHWSVHKSRTSRNEFFTSVQIWASEQRKCWKHQALEWISDLLLLYASCLCCRFGGLIKREERNLQEWHTHTHIEFPLKKLHCSTWWPNGIRIRSVFPRHSLCCAINHKGQMLKLAWWAFQSYILLMKCESAVVLIFKDAVRVGASWIIDSESFFVLWTLKSTMRMLMCLINK